MPGKLLIKWKFRGKYRCESLALWEILNVFLSVLSTFVPKCGIRDLRRVLLRMCSFLENRHREGCALIMGVMEIAFSRLL
jgi:hypothetical protein